MNMYVGLKTILYYFWFRLVASKRRFGRAITLFPRKEQGFTPEDTIQIKEIGIMLRN